MDFFKSLLQATTFPFFREMKNHLIRCKVIAGFCFFVSSATTDKIISPELNENIKHQPGDEILVVFTLNLLSSRLMIYGPSFSFSKQWK